MKYLGNKKLSTRFRLHGVLGGKKKFSTIFRLHQVLGIKIIHYIPITWSTYDKNYPPYSDHMKYLGINNYPLYSDYMKYLGGKKLSTIFRLHELLGKKQLSTIFRLHEVLGKKEIIHYIPITWSTWDKNYPLYSDYMKYLG